MRLATAFLLLGAAALAGPVSDAADKALAAYRAKQDLKPLAAKDEPDPWRVADELCAREEYDAAEAFAKAAPRKDVERLPAYVAAMRKRKPNLKAREALVTSSKLHSRKRYADALAEIGRVRPDGADVVSVRLLHGRGLALMGLRRLKQSAAACEVAADAAKRLGWLAREAAALHSGATSSRYANDFSGAKATWERCLALEESRGNLAGVASRLTNLGKIHQHLGAYAKALEYQQRSLKIRERLNYRPGIATSLGYIGAIHTRLGDHAKALDCLQRVLELWRELGSRGGVAATLVTIGGIHYALDDDARALECLEEGLREAEAIGQRRIAGAALGNIGLIHSRRANYSKALKYYQRGLKLNRESGDRSAVALSLDNIGITLNSLGRYAEALAILEEALRMAERLQARNQVAATLGHIGLVHRSLGNYPEALEYLHRALKLNGALGVRPGVAATLGQIGTVHQLLGAYAKALEFQQRALQLERELRDRRGEAMTIGTIGAIHYQLGDYDKALELYAQCLKVEEELGDRNGMASTLANIGLVYERRGDYGKALEFARRALKIKLELGRRADLITVFGSIGVIHANSGNHAKALEYHQRALKLSKELGSRMGEAASLETLGMTYRTLGDYAKALEYGQRALTLARELGSVDTEARSLWLLAEIHLRRGAPDKAVHLAREAVKKLPLLVGDLADTQGARARERWANLFGHGMVAAWALRDPGKFSYFAESGRAGSLLEALGGRARLRGVLIPRVMRAKEARARDLERKALLAYRGALTADGDVEAAWKQVEQARTQILDVVARIQRARKMQADLTYPKAASLAEIRAKLGAGDALVLYAYLGEVVALVVTREEARMVKLGDPGKLRALVEKFRAAVARPDERGMRAPEHERLPFLRSRLRKMLIAPLGLGDGITRLLVSPQEDLAYVPFSLLSEDEVVYVPSGTTYKLLADAETGKRGTQVLALGDPDYRGRHPALPESGREAKAVGDVVRLGKAATVAGLREVLARSARWRAVHLACHGVIDPQRPVLSALALSPGRDDDGMLRCLDVFSMKIPADLVVLSACETGKGKVYRAEGVIGFVRAFMMAGTPRVIVSLWKVDDAATRALMEKFYGLWKDSKMPAATALKQAQEHVASQERWKHPYFWAAWQLWGLGE